MPPQKGDAALKKMVRILCVILSVVCAGALGSVAVAAGSLPDSFSSVRQPFQVQNGWPLTAQRTEQSVAAGGNQSGDSYQAQLKLFGAVPVKTVQVQTKPEMTVIPCGTPFGIKMFAGGALIVGMTDVDTAAGQVNPSKDAGLAVGDVITRIGDQRVTTRQEVADLVEQSAGRELAVTFEHDGQITITTLKPQFSESAGEYKAGIWIRDSCAGIGTMTFVTTDGKNFAGLGHAICDTDTGQIMPMDSGEVVPVELIGVTKGVRGVPGELKGYFSSTEPQGTLLKNGETGVYGKLNGVVFSAQPVTVAMRILNRIRWGIAHKRLMKDYWMILFGLLCLKKITK